MQPVRLAFYNNHVTIKASVQKGNVLSSDTVSMASSGNGKKRAAALLEPDKKLAMKCTTEGQALAQTN